MEPSERRPDRLSDEELEDLVGGLRKARVNEPLPTEEESSVEEFGSTKKGELPDSSPGTRQL